MKWKVGLILRYVAICGNGDFYLGLVMAVQRQARQQSETLQPLLQTKWTAATQALATCLHVQELVQNWLGI